MVKTYTDKFIYSIHLSIFSMKSQHSSCLQGAHNLTQKTVQSSKCNNTNLLKEAAHGRFDFFLNVFKIHKAKGNHSETTVYLLSPEKTRSSKKLCNFCLAELANHLNNHLAIIQTAECQSTKYTNQNGDYAHFQQRSSETQLAKKYCMYTIIYTQSYFYFKKQITRRNRCFKNIFRVAGHGSAPL